MTTLATGLAGAAVGFFVGGPFGAQIGWLAGAAIGGILFNQGQDSTKEGARLEDRTVQTSAYGMTIARLHGTSRIAGNVIWATDLQETRTEQRETAGKGGLGGAKQTTVTYTYSTSVAISICAGEIVGIRKIWADNVLIYDVGSGNDGLTKNFDASSYAIYTGSETQEVDPTIAAIMGNAPAYRGQAYMVFTDLQLASYGNRIPNFTFEVVENGADAWRSVIKYTSTAGAQNVTLNVDPENGYLWYIEDKNRSGCKIRIFDPNTNTTVATISPPGGSNGAAGYFYYMAYNPRLRQFWVHWSGYRYGPYEYGIRCYSADGFSEVAFIDTGTGYFNDSLRKVGLLYNEKRGTMLWCGSSHPFLNAYNLEIDAYTVNPTQLNSVDGASRTIYIASRGEILSSNGYELMLLDCTTYAIKWQVTIPDISWQSDEYYTVDTVRGNVLFRSALNIVKLNLDNGDYTIHDISALVPISVCSIHYHAVTDRLLVSDYSTRGIIVLYPDTLTIDVNIQFPSNAIRVFDMVESPYYKDRIFHTYGNVFACFYLGQFLTSTDKPLADVITEESALVGIDPAYLDTSLITDTVTGYYISNTAPARSVIEQLMIAYKFDAAESGGKIKFVPRSSATTFTITDDDLAAHVAGTDTPELLPITRKDETEMPSKVSVKYLNIQTDYQVSTQNSIRMHTNSHNEISHDLPMVLSDAQAKSIAEVGMYSAWAARVSSRVTTTLKFAQIEPTDRVLVDGNLMRVNRKTIDANRIVLECDFETGSIYTQQALAAPALVSTQTIPLVTATVIEFIDSVMLRDQDNDAGFYIAASGYNADWPGCVIHKSADSGGTWSSLATITTPAVTGSTGSDLASGSDSIFDNFATLTVFVRSGELNGASQSAVLDGANAALVGDEVIQFKSATLIGTNTYLLSGLLRGRRGSPISSHLAGARFVLLDEATLYRVQMDSSEVGLSRQYRAVTIGAEIDGARVLTFTNTANGLECLSPVKVGAGRDVAGDIKISWIRRTRVMGAWSNYSDVPLAEETESYTVDIYNGATKIRTINSSINTVTYTAAQQTTDFGSVQSSVAIVAYQNSATNGAGFTFSGNV